MKNSKKILFVEKDLRNEKLGIMYLSSSLKKQGHHTDLIQVDKEDIDQKIKEYKPDFIAFSIATGEHVYALKTAKKIKEKYGIPNIFGGPHCTFFPEFAQTSGVDFIVAGQGEQAIIDIVEGKKKGFVRGRIFDHDTILPDRELFYKYSEFLDNPMKNIITSRACPYRCSYCFNHSYLEITKYFKETKKWFNRRSPKNIITEIEAINKKYPLDKILFIDDNFLQGGRSWITSFLERYVVAFKKFPWLCSMRVNHLNEKLAVKLFESGLEMVNFALESADPHVQKYILNRGHIQNRDIIQAILMFEKYGIRARMQNMIGLPLENSLEDALNTLQFNINHPVTDSWCSILQPYPRTALGRYCIDQGFISTDQLKSCSESFFNETRLNINNKTEINALQKLWYFIVEGKIPLQVVQVLIKGKYTNKIYDELKELRFKCSKKKLYNIDDNDPATVINLKKRENLVSSDSLKIKSTSNYELLMKKIFEKVPLPDSFIDIISQVRLESKEIQKLLDYISANKQNNLSVYTINDETGDLMNPKLSIYLRGTSEQQRNIIPKMKEPHFMDNVVDVYNKLLSG